jgi:choline-sulfatase
VDGESLVPLMSGASRSAPGGHRSAPVVGEYLAEGVNHPAVMVRRGAWKLIACPGDPDQLYDLSTDPAEQTNLAGSPEHAGVLHELREEVARRWDLHALEERVLASQRERHLILRALGEGAFRSWAYEPGPRHRYVEGGTDLYEVQRRGRLDAPQSTARPDAADRPA